MLNKLSRQTPPWTLRQRLMAGMAVGLLVVLGVTGGTLSRLFEKELEQQIQTELLRYLDRVTAQVTLSPNAPAQLDTRGLTDPRWAQPYSGLYWQLTQVTSKQTLRSRSLWDAQLPVVATSNGETDLWLTQNVGPKNQELMVLTRSVHHAATPNDTWYVSVAVDHANVHSATQSFNTALAVAMALLLLLMLALSWSQLRLGLAPLNTLQAGLDRLKRGDTNALEGHYPAELQPLVDDFNHALQQQRTSALLAREQAGNLAHGVKTPLSVMQQAAQPYRDHPLARTVDEQVTQAKRQIDWHLAKSRAAAAHQQIHEANAVSPMVDSLVRAMRVVHANKQLNLEWHQPEQHIDFLGAAQDFQEMLGNVLDNACMWAEHTVRISVAQQHSNQLQIIVQDDGPGLSAAHMQQVLQRGVRLDEQQAGSGLGLTITQDLAATYGGQLQLSASALGGLQATLMLPARLVARLAG